MRIRDRHGIAQREIGGNLGVRHGADEITECIFVEEMGWSDLHRDDGLEIDQFDHDEAVHQVVIRDGEVYVRVALSPDTPRMVLNLRGAT